MLTFKKLLCYNLYVAYERDIWGISSAGRAPRLHRGGQRFDPAMLHHIEYNVEKSTSLFSIICIKKFTFFTPHQDISILCVSTTL